MTTHAGAAVAQISLLVNVEPVLALLEALQLDSDMDILATIVLGESNIALDLRSAHIGDGLYRQVAL